MIGDFEKNNATSEWEVNIFFLRFFVNTFLFPFSFVRALAFSFFFFTFFMRFTTPSPTKKNKTRKEKPRMFFLRAAAAAFFLLIYFLFPELPPSAKKQKIKVSSTFLLSFSHLSLHHRRLDHLGEVDDARGVAGLVVVPLISVCWFKERGKRVWGFFFFFFFTLFRKKRRKSFLKTNSPAHELDELRRQRDPGLCVYDRRPRVADEVGRDDRVAGDAEDAFAVFF